MSRIGKKPITVPAGVKVAFDERGRLFKASGPLGALELAVRPEIKMDIKGSTIEVGRADDSRLARSLHGLTRTLAANMVQGVNTGFEKRLEIVGGWIQGGRSRQRRKYVSWVFAPVKYELPKGITASVDKQTSLLIKGPDKQLVGHVAANIRSFRPPEPYKGKGIKYANEVIRRKAGKAGKAAGGK